MKPIAQQHPPHQQPCCTFTHILTVFSAAAGGECCKQLTARVVSAGMLHDESAREHLRALKINETKNIQVHKRQFGAAIPEGASVGSR